MRINENHVPNHLSPAAREALSEHLNSERNRILAEAIRLSAGEPLSAFDIVNAVDLLTTRDREAPAHRYAQYRSERSRSNTMLVASLSGLAALTTTLVVVIVVFFQQSSSSVLWTDALLSVVAGAVGVLAVAAATTGLLYASRRSNRHTVELLAVHRRELEDLNAGIHTRRIPRDRLDSGNRIVGSFITNWIRLESELRDLGSERLGIPSEDARRYPIGELLRMLVKAGYFNDSDYELTRDLLTLRNEVMHGRDFDPDDLLRAETVISDLQMKLRARRRPATKS